MRIIAAFLLCFTGSILGDTITLTVTAPTRKFVQSPPLTLKSNEVAEVVFVGTYASDQALIIEKAGKLFKHTTGVPLPIIRGPASIKLEIYGPEPSTTTLEYSSFCTIQVTREEDLFVPSNSVVIPADGGGPVRIILESSTDLINWTAANPGTYGTDTEKRFFRVRAER